MRRIRPGTFSGVLAAGAVVAFAAANCASPTQIIVDVRTDPSLCDTIHSGIAVTTREEVDSAPLEVYQLNCEKDSDRIGTLTITPRSDNEAQVSIRIIGAVNGAHPDECGRTDSKGTPYWENCILARRNTQFAPGKTVPLTVVLSAACVGQVCADGKECNFGKCVRPEQVQDDGGNAPVKDGEAPYEDAEPADATDEEPARDACVTCRGPNGGNPQCDGVQNTCTVDCNAVDCTNRLVCGAGLDCTINCPNDKCDRTRCETTGSCQFTCTGSGQTCNDIQCRAGSCVVNCAGGTNTCDGVLLEAGTSTMTCQTNQQRATCDNVTCAGGTCVRTCVEAGLGCGPAANCTPSAGCAGWQDAGDGGN
jgi:hypothetical protein